MPTAFYQFFIRGSTRFLSFLTSSAFPIRPPIVHVYRIRII